MKRLFTASKTMGVMVFSFLISAVTFAQDVTNEVDLDINITAIDQGPFYAQLWFWVVLGLVFLLLLIALIRGTGGKKDKENKKIEEAKKAEEAKKTEEKKIIAAEEKPKDKEIIEDKE